MTPIDRIRTGERRFARGLVASCLLACVLIAGNDRAAAQAFPARTVRMIVPFPAGGTADAIPRILGDWLSRKWGQAVVIDNLTGAGGNIGAAAAYKAEPSGYTLLASPPAPLAINRHLYTKLTFDPAGFEPVIVVAQVPNALLVNPRKVSADTVPDFIAHLKANPGKLNAATQGIGTTSHLTSEMLQMAAEVEVRHIPYRGSAPALQALAAGDVDFMFDNLGVSLPLVQAGNLKLIAVASATRLASLPDVPTMAETLPGFESVAWFAIVAPPKTPQAVVQRLNADVNEALRQPEIQDRLKKLSAETMGGSVEAAARYMHDESERWYRVIKAANVELQ